MYLDATIEFSFLCIRQLLVGCWPLLNAKFFVFINFLDTQPPEITNCSLGTLYVNRMDEVTLPSRNVSDNSGATIHLEVWPLKFRFPTIVLTSTKVTYKATDWVNNTASCDRKIIVNGTSIYTFSVHRLPLF